MNWQVVSRPEAENDVIEIAAWYDSRSEGLGDRFVEEFLTGAGRTHDKPIASLPPASSQKHSLALSESFPYRVIYEVDGPEKTDVVAAVLHAARHDREWKRRV